MVEMGRSRNGPEGGTAREQLLDSEVSLGCACWSGQLLNLSREILFNQVVSSSSALKYTLL